MTNPNENLYFTGYTIPGELNGDSRGDWVRALRGAGLGQEAIKEIVDSPDARAHVVVDR